MNTCTIETGLLRKKPCGHVAVARCLNCDQPLCVEHSVAQLTDAGQKTGKFMCPECVAAAKEHAKSMAAVARSQEAKKLAALDKSLREQLVAPAPAKKPTASTHHAPAQPAPAEKHKQPETPEFTPKDGKSSYTRKEDEPGYKPD
jgi:hypothetical protein